MSAPDNHPDPAGGSPGIGPAGGSLPRRQRLEVIGLLAARVAHDLNNMLTPMQMALPLLRGSITDPSAHGVLDSMESMVQRSTGLVRQIVEYSRGGGGQLEPVLVQHLLEEIAKFAMDTFPPEIRVEQEIPADLWRVNVNIGQLHQVLVNLCVNAREAMSRGGALRLRAENCLVDAAHAADIEGARAGKFLRIEVEDTGGGFSAAVMARLWEPFVTTKPVGQGAGLGLSTVHEIIEGHGGFIKLRTAPGQGSAYWRYGLGSTFSLYLPAVGPAGDI